MKILSVVAVFCFGLGGCASLPFGSNCTNMITNNGAIVRFCAEGDKVQVAESGLKEPGDAKKIVDDPVALASLAKHVRLLAKYKGSRRAVAQSCSVGGEQYVNIKADDLSRIMRENVANRDQSASLF